MEIVPSNNSKLVCPSCHGKVDTIHPYYTANDHYLVLMFKNRWTWWVLVLFLLGLFWPIGVVGAIVLLIYEINSPKRENLYKCKKCEIEFSYNDAKNAAKDAT